MRRPDFFVVGAPKCGTTAIDGFLRQHPEIAMCSLKEPHFFGSDLRQVRHLSTENEYLALFPDAPDAKRTGETSVWYLYSQRAAEEIAAFSPGALIVAILRNPADMLYSLHSQAVYTGGEDILDFEGALAADADRERGRRPPSHERVFTSYRSVVRYADQIERYIGVFGRERVHVSLYEDFREDQLDWYRRTCGFLGVDDSFAPRIEVVNPSKRVRSRALRNLVNYPPAALRTAIRPFTTQTVRRTVAMGVKRLNTSHVASDPMPSALRGRLAAELAPEVRRLAELLDRDLSGWLEVS